MKNDHNSLEATIATAVGMMAGGMATVGGHMAYSIFSHTHSVDDPSRIVEYGTGLVLSGATVIFALGAVKALSYAASRVADLLESHYLDKK